jgi:hypothetical protein
LSTPGPATGATAVTTAAAARTDTNPKVDRRPKVIPVHLNRLIGILAEIGRATKGTTQAKTKVTTISLSLSKTKTTVGTKVAKNRETKATGASLRTETTGQIQTGPTTPSTPRTGPAGMALGVDTSRTNSRTATTGPAQEVTRTDNRPLAEARAKTGRMLDREASAGTEMDRTHKEAWVVPATTTTTTPWSNAKTARSVTSMEHQQETT